MKQKMVKNAKNELKVFKMDKRQQKLDEILENSQEVTKYAKQKKNQWKMT